LGSTYRAAGKLDKASRALAKALQVGDRCTDPDVRSDVLLRRAVLCAYLAQQPDGTLEPAGLLDAERLAQTAVDNARGSLARARARNTRGMILLYSGDPVRAAQDARWALATLDPEERPYDQVAALSLLVNALIEGDKADRAEAAGCLERLRLALPPRCPAIRGRVLWAEALLYFHDRQRKGRTRKLLNQARQRFVRRGMDAEAVAVTAELARHAPEGAVPRLCADLLPILTPGPIRDLVEQLRRARVVDRVAIAERLRRMVEGPGILPAAT
jgi:tetratricopeptide (TPR) repeat protein